MDQNEPASQAQGTQDRSTSRDSEAASPSARSAPTTESGKSAGTKTSFPTKGERVAAPDADAAPPGAGANASATAQAGPDADPGDPKPGDGSGGEQPASRRPVGPRHSQFMVASSQVQGLQPLSVDLVAQSLRDAQGIEFVKTINPPTAFGLQSANGGASGSVLVARMTRERAKLLRSQAGPRLVVEHDAPMTFGLDPGPGAFALPNPGVIVPLGDGFETIIEVHGQDGPLADADVFVFGSMLPGQGVTDAQGQATIKIVGESPATIRALYVKPKADYWDLWLPTPGLTPDAVNTVVAKPLGGFFKDFPDRQLLGWGQRAMGLDQVPPSFNGAGIKVAIVDSGAAQLTHRNLHRLGPGASVVGDDRNAWTNDTVGHGSHCAGIIAGGPVGSGVRGFAPAAEIHILRIFPGARFSDLVSALDYCMENGIDVVNMSLGGGEPSQIVEQRLAKAREMGVACIIAAGNSGGPVQFPASTRHALAVAAIGKWGEFPNDSFHATQALPGSDTHSEYFPAKFSCFGPEIDVCAPGVAIVSSLPPDDFAAWDGTSMATPHVTGLAALVLAHHPDFKGAFQTRDARRVERLFQIIKASATPLAIADKTRTGVGLPNVARALGVQADQGTRPAPDASPSTDPAMQILKRLIELLAGQNRSAPLSTMSASPSGQNFPPAGLASAPPGVGEAREILRQAGLL